METNTYEETKRMDSLSKSLDVAVSRLNIHWRKTLGTEKAMVQDAVEAIQDLQRYLSRPDS